MAGAVPRFNGTTRGVFGMCTWAALRKPGETAAPSPVAATAPASQQLGMERQRAAAGGGMGDNFSSAAVSDSQTKTSEVKAPNAVVPGQRLIAKYNYKANPASPLGVNAELSINQFDKMKMVAPHKLQEFWWMVELDDGRRGYVPANYVMPFEEKVTSLPWLAKPVEAPLPVAANQPYKPYKSAYDNKAAGGSNKEFFCDVCQKQFNGPQPFSAHMNSKAHREELELQGLN